MFKKFISKAMALALVVTSLNFSGAYSNNAVSADSTFTDLSQKQIVTAMGAGWNLGNQLEASSGGVPAENAWNNGIITKDLIDEVKNAGFNTIRVPVSYLNKITYSNGKYSIDAAWLARIKEVVDMCMDNDLYTIINIHGDGYIGVDGSWLLCASSDQDAIREKYEAVWGIIADYFKDYDEHLIFESMNEEFDGTYTGNPNKTYYANINAYNQIFVDTVRKSGGNNDKRWLLIPGWNTDIDLTVGNYGFELPTDNYLSSDIADGQKRIMISVHYYSPWEFAGEGSKTQWGDNVADSSKAVSWYNKSGMNTQFKKMYDKFVTAGYPVVIGEYGATNTNANDELNQICRVDYYNSVCTFAKEYGLVPVAWDNGGYGTSGGDQFALINRNLKTVYQQDIVNGIMEVYNPDKVVEESDDDDNNTTYMAQLIDNGWNGNWGSAVAQTEITKNGEFKLKYTLGADFENQGAMYINTTIPVTVNCTFEVESITLNGTELGFNGTQILNDQNEGEAGCQWQFLFMNKWGSFNGIGDYLTTAKAGDVLEFTINVSNLFSDKTNVYVTIINAGEVVSDNDGNAVASRKFKVADTNDNSFVDVDDVLRTVHNDLDFSDGYESSVSSWGLYLAKLWGVENGGSYGYYVNNKAAFSLEDKVEDGDYVSAFVYKDLTAYTDAYTYFDELQLTLKYDNPVANLKLYKIEYDETYSPVSVPVTDAVITTLEDDTLVGSVDEEGNVTITLKPGNTYTVIAKNDEKNYVPAVCKVEVEAAPKVVKVEAVEASCTEGGNTEYYYYTVEGKTYYFTDEECANACEENSWIIPAKGHAWDEGVVTKEATTTQEGIKTYTCANCNETKTEVIEKLKDDSSENGDNKDGESDKKDDQTGKTEPAVDETKADGPVEGKTIKDKKYIYKVTKAGSTDGKIVGELEVTGLKKKSLTVIKIAATVKLGGVTYKVTSVGSKAFKNNKKIKKVFVGKNVVTIAANAFAGCKKLKQVSINSTVLKSIGKKAFFGTKSLKKVIIKSTKLKTVGKKAFYRKGGKKLTVKVPKAKKTKYKKLFKKAKTNKYVVK